MEAVVDMAKITSKGQVTIPQAIRSVLGVKKGDRVLFSADRAGVVTVRNASLLQAVDKAADSLAGTADEAGIESDDDVVALVREIRYGRAGA